MPIMKVKVSMLVDCLRLKIVLRKEHDDNTDHLLLFTAILKC